jgi:hypothetical protein
MSVFMKLEQRLILLLRLKGLNRLDRESRGLGNGVDIDVASEEGDRDPSDCAILPLGKDRSVDVRFPHGTFP